MTEPPADAHRRHRSERGWWDGRRTISTLATAGVCLVIMALAFFLAIDQFHVPSGRDASAPESEFSSERAMAHVRAVAAAPRPQGSEAATAAREYAVRELERLGLRPEIQRTTAVRTTEGSDAVFAATVVNVLVRIPGTDSGGAVVLSGHYDSGPNALGAGDCGSCVATVLEVARALAAGPLLRNDVILLIPDGEETQLFGGWAFMRQHPWAADVRFALNLESQGIGGPAVFYVSGEDDQRVASRVFEYAGQPAGWSFLTTLVRGLVGGSDLDAFTNEGVAGAGVAFFEAPQYYHTRLDSPDRLDEGSVQHLGDYALRVVRGVADDDLDTLEADADGVYFTLWRGTVVQYPGILALPFALLATLALGAVLFAGRRRGRLRLAQAAAAGALFVAAVLLVVIVTTLLWVVVRATNPDFHVMLVGVTYEADRFVVGFSILASAWLLGGYLLAARRWGRLDVLAGVLLFWWAMALLLAVVLPGFSALFLWPLLAGVAALGFEVWRPWDAARAWGRIGAFAAVVVVTTLLVLPAVVLFQTLGGRVEAISGLPLLGLPILWVALALGLVLPVAPLPALPRAWTLPAGLAALGLAFIVGVSVSAGFDADHPKPNMMLYRLDADAGSAVWETVADPAFGRGRAGLRDEWTSQFLEGAEEAAVAPWSDAPDMTSAGLRAPAPPLPLAAPTVEVIASGPAGEGRALTLRVASPRGAPRMRMYIEGGVTALRVDGQAAALEGVGLEGGGRLHYVALPSGGIEVELETSAGGPLRVTVEDWSQGLPEMPGIAQRPPEMMPSAHDLADTTMVRKSYVLE